MIGVVMALAIGLLSGKRARDAYCRGAKRRWPYMLSTVAVSSLGAYIDLRSDIWVAIGFGGGHNVGALYFLGYIAASIYVMSAAYYNRIIPFSMGR